MPVVILKSYPRESVLDSFNSNRPVPGGWEMRMEKLLKFFG